MTGSILTEIPILVNWILLFFIFGLIGQAALIQFTTNWVDKGYGISKFLGLMICALPLWFLSSLKIVPFNELSVWIFTLIFFGIAVFILLRKKYRPTRYVFIQEILFIIILLFWAAIRSTNSQAEGTEKLMNLAFMNSIDRTTFFPPLDPWQAGQYFINYYYLGHYLFVFAGKLIEVKVAYVYNLSLITIIAYSFIALVSVIAKLCQGVSRKFALIFLVSVFGAAWICFGGNMHYAYKMVEAAMKGVQFSYFFPDGTRIIAFVIDEFPAYSVTLGDVHGHYLAFPLMIMFIGLMIIAVKFKINSKQKILFNLAISPLLFAMYGINSWDFITLNFLFVVMHLYQAITLKEKYYDKLLSFIAAEFALVFPGIIFMLPYFLVFKPPVGGIGIGPLTRLQAIAQMTPAQIESLNNDPLAWVLMWGIFLLINFSYIFNGLLRHVLNYFAEHKQEKYFAYLKSEIKAIKNKQWLVFVINIAVICLLVGVEVFFVKDIFFKSNLPYFRTNTVFKFYYHIWILWGIICSYYFYRLLSSLNIRQASKLRSKRLLLLFLMSFLSLSTIVVFYYGSIIYIQRAVYDFYSFLKLPDYKYPTLEQLGTIDTYSKILFYDTLDGNAYILKNHNEDYGLITWINTNIGGQPVILEATGDAYTYYARVSADTGLPTVMGWPTHEWQWRDTSEEAFKRKGEVQTMYTTTDEDEFKNLIKKYNVSYVVIGGQERISYNTSDLKLNDTFIKKYGQLVFKQSETYLYKVSVP